MGASLMLTIDESFNELEECDVTTHDAMDCRRFNEWMTATIKMRRVGDAPEWLDPDSTDTDVIANRDCSRDPFSGVIDSVCYTNYDCDAISQWKPVKEYIDQHFPSGLESCDFFTKPGGVNGYSLYDAIMTEWPEYPPVSETCSCNNCKCTGLPSPKVLSRSFNEEGTTRSVKWEPGGEHMPHCAGSCPSSTARVQFTSDFKDVLQEVVDLSSYDQGNALAIIIDGHQDLDNTPALRSYESWDGTNTEKHSWTSGRPAFGPTLFVSYCDPPPAEGAGSEKSNAALVGSIVGGVGGVLVILLALCIWRLISRERAGKPLFVSVAIESKGPNGHGGATYPVVPDEV